jgi:hypothetical protein
VKARAGWYVDWDDWTRQRYFTGTEWTADTVERTPEASELPARFDANAARQTVAGSPRQPSDGLTSAGGFVYVVAALTALGALIGGIGLISHAVPSNCDLYSCSGTTHPFSDVGWAVLVAGLMQAVTVAVIGRLCFVVSEHRVALADLGKP